jgi:hypothetical protein
VTDALLHESTGELYDDAEKVVILTCLQRVQEVRHSVEPPQEETDYTTSMAKSIAGTQQVMAQQINALGGKP